MRNVAEQGNREQKANSIGARRRLKLWFVFMFLFVGWAAYLFIAQAGDINDRANELAQKEADKQANEQTLERLKYDVNRLQDPEYIGQIAMKKYGLYLPGDTPVRFTESEDGNQ